MWAIKQGTKIKIYNDLPSDYGNVLNFKSAGEEIHKQYGFYPAVIPTLIEGQMIGDIYFDESNEVFTYPIINKTPEQIIAEQIERIDSQARTAEFSIDQKLLKKLLAPQIEAIPEAEAIEFRTLYKPYRVGITFSVNERFYYPINDKLYKVIQSHTTQLDWKPDQTPALYLEVSPPGIIPNWRQPTGAHDAYQIKDKVIHNTFTWENNVINNVWEPGIYGWTKL